MDLEFNSTKLVESAGDHSSFVKTDDFDRKNTSSYPAGDDDDKVELLHELDSLAGTHQPIKSNSHDDFEYVGAPSSNDLEIDLIGGGPTSSVASKPSAGDLLGDFKDQSGIFSHKAATMDFMAAERQIAASHSPSKTTAAAAQIDERDIDDDEDVLVPAAAPPLKNSIYDDIENDYLKPLQHDTISTEAANEKFISSEDLLGDFDQPEELAPPVPKHSGVEDMFKVSDEKSMSFQPSLVHVVDPVVEVKPVAPVKPLPAEPIPAVVSSSPPAVAAREAVPPTTKAAPKEAPPQPPARTITKETKILADEIFCKIGLGERNLKTSSTILLLILVFLMAPYCLKSNKIFFRQLILFHIC